MARPDAGVAAGRLDDRAAGLQATVGLGALDHLQGGAVLRREARVVELELGEQVAVEVAGRPVEPHHRGVADERDEVVGHVHRLAGVGDPQRGHVVDGDVVVGVEHHRQPALVELLGDRRGLGAGAEHADAARDVAAQVGDQREQRLAGRDVHGAARPGREPRGRGGVADDHEQVHGSERTGAGVGRGRP